MEEIIEVVQFASGDHLEKEDFDSLTEKTVLENGEEICTAIGTGFIRKQVNEKDNPSIGCVWYKKDKNGKCKLYLYNYDSSD